MVGLQAPAAASPVCERKQIGNPDSNIIPPFLGSGCALSGPGWAAIQPENKFKRHNFGPNTDTYELSWKSLVRWAECVNKLQVGVNNEWQDVRKQQPAIYEVDMPKCKLELKIFFPGSLASWLPNDPDKCIVVNIGSFSHTVRSRGESFPVVECNDKTNSCETFDWSKTLKVNVDIKFTIKFNIEEDSVETTLWVKQTAFTCLYKLNDLKLLNFTISNTENQHFDKMCLAPKIEKVIRRETTVPPEATLRADNDSDQLDPERTTEETTIINEESPETSNRNTGNSSVQDDKGDDRSESAETIAWHNIRTTTILRKWKPYNLKITVVDEDGNTTEIEVAHDTLEWSCKDGDTRIPRIQICNHSPDCPCGEDEGEVCTPSALHRKLSFICYAFMATIIIIYIFWKTCCKKTGNSKTKNTTERVNIDGKNVFLSRYKEAHVDRDKFLQFLSEVKFALYKAGSPEKTAQVCQDGGAATSTKAQATIPLHSSSNHQ